ncbi:FMN-binding negative transcriptional regulator [Jatrophihabitans telluris]|uniref:FMN-binding negative transcriptional regulator n=1 Tax=Jatrophihabitans telluris TaxID=2038343 RepID=A0ABY4QZ83_9ACTN|nr:FMN-binding negative transcriptional regulator [Jatrophihabitans telluris]UQX88894.1 FMN-binding negative transcriptional regulator [Jatrophihabitans telluris]
MYVPSHFVMPPERARQVLESVNTADLVGTGPDGLVATFLPLLYDAGGGPHGRLLGHVARNNPQWEATGDVLAILRGPDAYISPGFYASKPEHGRVVPTWNYETVHVYGRLVAHDDVEWLRGIVTRLTERHEASRADPWSVTDAPPAFIDGQLRAIVGLELVIFRVEAKSKLSQNRTEADQAGVVAGLGPADPIARKIADRLP